MVIPQITSIEKPIRVIPDPTDQTYPSDPTYPPYPSDHTYPPYIVGHEAAVIVTSTTFSLTRVVLISSF